MAVRKAKEGEITPEGGFRIKRAGIWIDMKCMNDCDTDCGQGCALFGEPIKKPIHQRIVNSFDGDTVSTSKFIKNLFILPLCQGSWEFEKFVDDR